MAPVSVCLLMLAIGMVCQVTADNLDHYIVEILFVIEPQVIRNYEKFGYNYSQAKTEIDGDMKYFVFEANKLYESLSNSGIYLELRAVDIVFSQNEIYGEEEIEANTTLDADAGLDTFMSWMKANKIQDSYSYDFAFIMTGYDIAVSGNNQVSGFAPMETVCDEEENAGLVEYTGAMSTVITLAHELGHSLGADHDGSANLCRSSEGYVMAAASSPENSNRWSFSSCSESSIAKFIQNLNFQNQNCMKETTAPPSTFSLKDAKDRDILNRDKVCERERHSPNSFFCTNDELYGQQPKGDTICKTMWCGTQQDAYCWTGTPTEGMVCDVGKRCAKGECVTAPVDFPTPSNLNPACLWKDTKTSHLYLTFDGGCKEYIRKYGIHQCYDSVFEHRCCSSCGEHYTGIKGCEYGDKVSNCKQYKGKSACKGSLIKSCCETCKEAK